MSSSQKDPRVAGNPLLDSVLTLVAFVIFFLICRRHVPSEDPTMINLWGAFTAACMTGVFWFALHMFKATLRGQRDSGAPRK